MTIYNTKNPLGSTSPKDVNDNAITLDNLVNSTESTTKDRFGNDRLTIKGLEEAAVSAGPTVEAAVKALEQANEAKKTSDAIKADTENYIRRAETAADASRSSASNSQASAIRSENAAVKAESVVDVEGTYPDIATGLAATAEGKYFRVPQGVGSDLSFIYYQSINGEAVPATTTLGNPDILSLTKVGGRSAKTLLNSSIAGSNTQDNVNIRIGSTTGVSALIAVSPLETLYIGMPTATYDRFRVIDLPNVPVDGMKRAASRYTYNGLSEATSDAYSVIFQGKDYTCIPYTTAADARFLMLYQRYDAIFRAPVIMSSSRDVGFELLPEIQSYKINNDVSFSTGTEFIISDVVRENMGGECELVGSSHSAEVMESLGLGYDNGSSTVIVSSDSSIGDELKLWVNSLLPNKTYTFIARQLDEKYSRFRIALFDESPRRRSTATTVVNGLTAGTMRKDFVGLDGNTYTYVTFTTSSSERWVASNLTQTGQNAEFAIVEGEFKQGVTERSVSDTVSFGQPVRAPVLFADTIVSNMFSRGKNLFDGNYIYSYAPDIDASIEGYYSTQLRSVRILEDETYKDVVSIIIPCLPNTKYAISRSGGTRFFIGTSKFYPGPFSTGKYQGLMHVVVNDNSLNSYVFETIDSDRFITVYLSNEGGVNWCQIEQSDRVTPYETYGWKFSQAAELVQSAASGAGTGYISAGVGDGVSDDYEDLQAVLNFVTGAISFDPAKKYFISQSLKVNASTAKGLYGNRATFIVGGDFPAFTIKGGMSGGSANPATNGAIARSEGGFHVDSIRAYSSDLVSGVGVALSNVFKPRITNCDFMYLKHGIHFSGLNRDVIITDNHVYACHDYGVYFDNTADIHQLNVLGNIITYCTRNIFLDNADIYNLQIVGNDIELGTYPTDVAAADKADIWITAMSSMVEDVSILGNTLEDHWTSDRLVKMEGRDTANILSVVISGNSSGNSSKGEIELGGVSGVYIDGQFKKSSGDTLVFTGNVDGLTMSVQANKQGWRGGLVSCNGAYSLSNIQISGCQMNGSGAYNAVRLLGKPTLKNVTISGNNLHDRSTETPILIDAAVADGVRVDFNQIRNTENTSGQAILITAETLTDKNSVLFNSATKGDFTAEGFNVNGNF
nr:right-handed parallel beta-helix repeat-containing protein [Providencia rettgeri]